MPIKSVQETFREIPSTVTKEDAHTLIKAAERENENAGGCCRGPGTEGKEHLRDIFMKPENGPKLRDPTVRQILGSYLHIDSQSVGKTAVVEKK